ncbi:hypothetical protein PoB_006180200 [Plakobranchus ocellatus]|uniref:Uncharacterized protein n=1 Tax=Plakobranchus ocellatus TaxID=259542 RepID=A0AAV4CTR4_9GAST|nr:hypothetical protein PoB_006180200 [Plakobranchus ocellatus]
MTRYKQLVLSLRDMRLYLPSKTDQVETHAVTEMDADNDVIVPATQPGLDDSIHRGRQKARVPADQHTGTKKIFSKYNTRVESLQRVLTEPHPCATESGCFNTTKPARYTKDGTPPTPEVPPTLRRSTHKTL